MNQNQCLRLDGAFLLILVTQLFAAQRAQTQGLPGSTAITNIYSFSGTSQGTLGSEIGLVKGANGNFYGTTEAGGSNQHGTVFTVTPSGTLTTLHFFTNGPDGANPFAGLVQGTDGFLYGTTSYGGAGNYGTVFKMSSTGALTPLYPFTHGLDGWGPNTSLIQGSGLVFYGTAEGGANQLGTIFQITSSGALMPLYAFQGTTDGYNPDSSVTLGTNGNLYGTTDSGGVASQGNVFMLTPSGTFTNIYSFANGVDGAYPESALTLGADNSFYGTTYFDDQNYAGTIFKITPAGVLTTLHLFSGSDGSASRSPLTLGSDGYFYGVTTSGGLFGQGVLFNISPSGSFTTLYSFTDGTDGGELQCPLAVGNDGNLYGVTSGGGNSRNGSIFRFTAPPIPPAIALQPQSQTAALGSTVVIGSSVLGSPPLSYQWFLNGNPLFNGTGLTGAQSSQLTFNPALPDEAGTYFLLVTNLYGTVTSATAIVTLTNASGPPLILVQPADEQAVWAGSTATFSVVATGSAPLSYQWYYYGSPLSDGGSISGSQEPMLTLTSAENWGEYYVQVVNQFGFTNSSYSEFDVGFLDPLYFSIDYGEDLFDADIELNPFEDDGGEYGVYLYGGTSLNPPGTDIPNAGSLNVVATFTPGSGEGLPPITTNLTVDVQYGHLFVQAYNYTEQWGQWIAPDENFSSLGFATIGDIVKNDPIFLEFSGYQPGPFSPPGTYEIPITVTDSNGGHGLLENYNISFANNINYATVTQLPPTWQPPNNNAPVNDAFENRILLTGANPTTTGSNYNATLEPGEPSPGNVTGPWGSSIQGVTNSVWWSWVAPANGLVKVNAEGSDFETFINVYTGDTVTNLLPVASNLALVATNCPSGLSNQLVFFATAGTTYQISIAGFAEGNIQLAIDPIVLQTLTLNESFDAQTNMHFSANIGVGNAGLAAVGPNLRLEVLTSAGYSEQTFNEFLDTPTNQVLEVLDLPTLSTIAPGTTNTVSISGICPGPSGNNVTYGYGTGVFVLLQQQLGTNWVVSDKELLDYGVWPSLGTFNGPGGGVIRINPSVTDTTPYLYGATIYGPAKVYEGTSAGYYGIAQFSGNINVNFTNTVWTVSPSKANLTITTNGIFLPLGLATNTTVTVTGFYDYNGDEYSNSMPVAILTTPTLGQVTQLTNNDIQFTLSGLQKTNHYVVDTTTNLSNPALWVPLATNLVTTGQWTFIDTNENKYTRRFYRARQTP